MYRGPGLQYFQGVARETAFLPSALEKAYRLVEILAQFEEEKLLKTNLALKGGTALQFAYLGVRRLSVDADFNLLLKDREAMIAARREMEKVLPLIFQPLGYEFDAPRDEYGMLAYKLSYRTATGGRDLVKIEINMMERIPALSTTKRVLVHPFALQQVESQTYMLAELAAGKVRALLQREGPKDVFDAAMLNNQIGPGIRSPARELSVLYCTLGNTDLRNHSLHVDANPREIRNVLLPYLRGNELDPVDVTNLANQFIEPLQTLTEPEVEFVTKFFGDRTFQPEVLFRGIPHNPELAEHPVARWLLRPRKPQT